jgi:prevent-host-death family protein
MAADEVTIRELRNHGGEVVERVAHGERLTVTRAGRPVAELRPVPATPVPVATLIERRRLLPVVDPDHLRRDVEALLDSGL